jgi:hypothetical protein
MDFIIVSYQQAGLIRLGMMQAEVRHVLGEDGIESRSDRDFWEAFLNHGVQVLYEDVAPYRCRAIMLHPPAQPIFHGRNLCNSSIKDLKDWFQLMDESIQLETFGLMSRKLGLQLSCEDYSLFADQPPTSVMIFEPDYVQVWDDLRDMG